MRRLTKTERAAAMAVLAMAASVAGAGVTLLRKHARLMARKAAAMFQEEAPSDADAGTCEAHNSGEKVEMEASGKETEISAGEKERE